MVECLQSSCWKALDDRLDAHEIRFTELSKDIIAELKSIRAEIRENELKRELHCNERHKPISIRVGKLEGKQEANTTQYSQEELERRFAAMKRELQTASTARDIAMESEKVAKTKLRTAIVGGSAAILMSVAALIIEFLRNGQ